MMWNQHPQVPVPDVAGVESQPVSRDHGRVQVPLWGQALSLLVVAIHTPLLALILVGAGIALGSVSFRFNLPVGALVVLTAVACAFPLSALVVSAVMLTARGIPYGGRLTTLAACLCLLMSLLALGGAMQVLLTNGRPYASVSQFFVNAVWVLILIVPSVCLSCYYLVQSTPPPFGSSLLEKPASLWMRSLGMITSPVRLIRANRTSFLAILVVYMASTGLGVLTGLASPDGTPGPEEGNAATGRDNTAAATATDRLSSVLTRAVEQDDSATTTAYFVTHNLIVSEGIFITTPSFIIPFSGLLTGIAGEYWSGEVLSWIATGIGPVNTLGFIGVWFLEFLSSVLAGCAVFLQGRALIKPATLGATSRASALVAGLRVTAAIYAWILIVLIVAAILETNMILHVPYGA